MIKAQKTFIYRSLFRIGAVLTALSLLLSACTPAMHGSADEEQPGSEESDAADRPADVPTPTTEASESTKRATEVVPVSPSDDGFPGEPVTPGDLSPPVTGEVPTSLLEDIRTDLAQRTGVTQDSILVIRDQAVIWSDGSLGCPQPGVFYTQALVQGYWVVLQVGEKQYDYRASERGYFLLCEGGSLPFTQPIDQ